MKIFLITDVHYGQDLRRHPEIVGEGSFGMSFPSFAEGIRERAAGCDLIVNLGDFIEQTKGEAKSADADEERYVTAMRVLEGTVPVRHVVGNHDLVNMNRDRVAGLIGEESIRYRFDFGGFCHIVLDGNREGKGWPEPFQFDAAQIAWLEEELARATLPVVIYSHYPIADYDVNGNPIFSLFEYGMAFPLRADRILATVEASGKALAVFSGHMHFSHQQLRNGILHFTIGSFSQNDGHDASTTEYAIASIGEGGTVAVESGRIRET